MTGSSVQDRRVLVVEDVVGSSGQVARSTDDLRRLGAQVTHARCVIDREEGGRDRLASAGLELRSLVTRRDLEDTRTG